MASTKLYDIVVKTSEYPDGQGGMKGRFENIGSMMQGDNGQFLILKRTFNIAGVPNPDGKDSIIASLFEPNNNNQQAPQQQQGQQQQNFAPQQHQQAPQQGNYPQRNNYPNGG